MAFARNGLKEVFDESEFSRWFTIDKKTWVSAEGDLERGDFDWTCFKAQQSAEYAAKALLHGLGLEAYGLSVSKLLSKLTKDLDYSKIIQEAKTLDKYYVPTRYPMHVLKGYRWTTIHVKMHYKQ